MSFLRRHGETRVLQLFCSYAREDREGVRVLLDGVRHLRHQVWVDERLSGGQAWLDEILAQIRGCDAMLIAISPALLESQVSALERQYGARVGKPMLPVMIRPVLADLLPPDLAPLQCIDYTQPGPKAAFELAGALYGLPPAGPLPDPLPDPPPVPISYLSGLSDRVQARRLSLDDQLAVVARLRTAMERPREREAAVNLLQAMRQRTDLYHAPAMEIDKLMREQIPGSAYPPHLEPIAPSTGRDTRDPVSGVLPDSIPEQPTAPPLTAAVDERPDKTMVGSEVQTHELRPRKIFLCYRREDTQGFARGIYDSLSAKYGDEQVFRDIDSTPPGVRYSAWIESMIGQCSVMIVLIGHAWLSVEDDAGRRRLEAPRDWVRQEIEVGLRREIPIIPVCVQGARMPSEGELPSSIADLTGFQNAEITDSRWDFDITRLLQAIDDLIASDDQ
jgi:hypothetical protein